MKVLANVYRIIYSTDWTKYQTAIVAAQNTRKAEILLEARLRQCPDVSVQVRNSYKIGFKIHNVGDAKFVTNREGVILPDYELEKIVKNISF